MISDLNQTEFYHQKREAGYTPRPQTNKVITGEIVRRYPTTYSIRQVSEMIGESTSAIRFWCDEFGIKTKRGPNNVRMFTDENLFLLKDIKNYMRVQKLTLEGAKLKMK